MVYLLLGLLRASEPPFHTRAGSRLASRPATWQDWAAPGLSGRPGPTENVTLHDYKLFCCKMKRVKKLKIRLRKMYKFTLKFLLAEKKDIKCTLWVARIFGCNIYDVLNETVGISDQLTRRETSMKIFSVPLRNKVVKLSD